LQPRHFVPRVINYGITKATRKELSWGRPTGCPALEPRQLKVTKIRCHPSRNHASDPISSVKDFVHQIFCCSNHCKIESGRLLNPATSTAVPASYPIRLGEENCAALMGRLEEPKRMSQEIFYSMPCQWLITIKYPHRVDTSGPPDLLPKTASWPRFPSISFSALFSSTTPNHACSQVVA
jgi:hypothetical protein